MAVTSSTRGFRIAMDAHTRHFISTWAVTLGAIVALTVIFNVVVDPYRLLGWNLLEPAGGVDQRLFKAYEVMHAAPNALILGSSSVEIGIDAHHPAWPHSARPIYNLGIFGATPYLCYRYLQHVLSSRPLTLVVIGLDFEGFIDGFQKDAAIEPEVESRLTVNSDGSINPEQGWAYARDLLRSLSLSELVDSTATVADRVTDDSNFDVSGDFVFNRSELRELSTLGSMRTFLLEDVFTIQYFHRLSHAGVRIDAQVLLTLRDILHLCDSHGTHVILFINPVHADRLEIWDSEGLWTAFEDWKRQLTALTHEYSQAHVHSRISLWDFSGYHDYATETVVENRPLHEKFFDLSHYTWAVGDIIIRQILGQGGARPGTELTPENVEAHLATLRKQQQEYRIRQPLDVQRVRLLYKGLADTVVP